MEEKLKELEQLEKKLRKLEIKSYQLIGMLKATEEFDSRFSSIKWCEDGLEHFGKWFRSELGHQRETIMREIEKEAKES